MYPGVIGGFGGDGKNNPWTLEAAKDWLVWLLESGVLVLGGMSC
jgi:hypothetical protein